MVFQLHLAQFHILASKSVIPNFVACLVFLGIAFSFIKLIFSSGTSTKREAAADAILRQWERANFYNTWVANIP